MNNNSKRIDFNKFENLDYDKFRQYAKREDLSGYEKVGFPDEYRKGKEELIFQDILQKLPVLSKKNQVILDIGVGCSDLPQYLIDLCKNNNHKLILSDSPEMLSLLPDYDFIEKIPGFYPKECKNEVEKYFGQIDGILTYSVIQYVIGHACIFDFIDISLSLLKNGGQMLIGDIPNISKRKRFFSSETGIHFHQSFTGTDGMPVVKFNNIETGNIDDSIVMSILSRCRTAGFDAYVLPQADLLPMANRREDILIIKP